MENFNEEDVNKFFLFFNHSQPTEIRLFDKVKYPKGKSIFVKNRKEFVAECKKYTEEEVSIYIGARDRKDKGDKNIISSNFIFFETDGDVDGTKKKELLDFLKSKGIEVGMIGMSGGGWHFYIPHKKVEFANAEEGEDYKKRSLDGFKKAILDKGFDIDPAVFNLERVTRVLGTFNCKRKILSYIEEINNDIDIEKNTKNLTSFVQMNTLSPTIKPKGERIESIYQDKVLNEVKSKWQEGDRQNLTMYLAGYLRKEKRLGLNSAIEIIRNVCYDCGDEDFNERLNAINSTYNKDEDEIKGASGLIEREINLNEVEEEKGDGLDKAELIWDKDLENYEVEDKEWLIDGLIPVGAIGVWTGNRATFKSFLVMNASYCISNGLKFLGDYETKKGKVIYLDKENGIPIMKNRSKMIKAGLSIEKGQVGYICFSQLKLDNERSITEIKEIIDEHKPSLLVIDTYRRAISFDENSAGDVSWLFVNILRPIVDKNRNLTILLIHHNRKGNGMGDKMNEIRGSSDLANYCDFILSNNRKNGSIILEQLKNRNAPEVSPIPIRINTDEKNYIKFEKGEESNVKTRDEKATEVLIIWLAEKKITRFRTKEWDEFAITKDIKKNSRVNALKMLVNSGILIKGQRGIFDVVTKELQGNLD